MKLRKKLTCFKSIKLTNKLIFQQRLLKKIRIQCRVFFFQILMTVLFSQFFQQLLTLRKKCPYSEFFCSVFSRIRRNTEISLSSVRMPKNTEHKNYEYGHFSRSVKLANFRPIYEMDSKN